jgi:hypothetical protein
MNPVIGLDVSKGESEVQAFLDKGKPYGKSFSIKHDLNGLGRLLSIESIHCRKVAFDAFYTFPFYILGWRFYI